MNEYNIKVIIPFLSSIASISECIAYEKPYDLNKLNNLKKIINMWTLINADTDSDNNSEVSDIQNVNSSSNTLINGENDNNDCNQYDDIIVKNLDESIKYLNKIKENRFFSISYNDNKIVNCYIKSRHNDNPKLIDEYTDSEISDSECSNESDITNNSNENNNDSNNSNDNNISDKNNDSDENSDSDEQNDSNENNESDNNESDDNNDSDNNESDDNNDSDKNNESDDNNDSDKNNDSDENSDSYKNDDSDGNNYYLMKNPNDSSSEDESYNEIKSLIDNGENLLVHNEDLAARRQCIANGIDIDYHVP